MEVAFSMEKFPRSAVGFRWKEQDATRARIFPLSALLPPWNLTLTLHGIVAKFVNLAYLVLLQDRLNSV